MNPGFRKLAGTLMLLAFVLLYIFAAMLLAALMLPNSGLAVQFVYYAFAGLAWVPPAGLILNWMYRT